MKRHRLTIATLATLLAVTFAAPAAKAIDISPGDYAYLPAGTVLGLGYLGYQSASSFRDRTGISYPNSRDSAIVALARALYYGETNGVGWAIQAIVPAGALTSARVGGSDLPKANGLGDVILGATVFPVHSADPTGTTLGLTAYLGLPTGNYSPLKASIGSGGFTITPQIGLIQGLGNGFFLDTAFDAAFSTDHTNTGIRVHQDTSIEAQAYLRYAFSKATSVSAGYSGTYGGQIYYNGSAGLTKTREDQVKLFASTFVAPTVQLQGMIGTDIAATGGFRNDIITQIRILKIF